MIHVLMISTDATFLAEPTETIGNTRARHQRYAELADARISVVICNRQRPDGAPLTPYQAGRVTARPTNSPTYRRYLAAGFEAGMAFAREQPVDLITSQDPFLTGLIGLRLRKKLGVPLIVQDHACFISSRYYVTERPRHRWLRTIAGYVLPRADSIRVVNKRERLAILRLGIKGVPICVVPVATETERFAQPVPDAEKQAWRQRLNIAPDAPTVLWVGRPVKFKNLPLLVNAFARVHRAIPAARLILAGDLSDSVVPDMVEELGLQDAVRMPGPVAYADLPALYQTANVYALSSDYEGFGRVLVEAGAAGLPIVSTDNEGANDIILNNVTGLLTPIRDVDAFANALADFLRHPVRAHAMSKKARQHILAHFAEADVVRRWPDMWRETVAGRSPCGS